MGVQVDAIFTGAPHRVSAVSGDAGIVFMRDASLFFGFGARDFPKFKLFSHLNPISLSNASRAWAGTTLLPRALRRSTRWGIP